MLIFHDLSRKSEYPTVAALGFFDGVHLGHRAVIAEALCQARKQGTKCAVFTFEPPHHTDRAVSKSDVKLLQSPESRDRVMEELGVELVLCPPFESFYNFSPEEFVREILKNCLNCRGVVCGEDYRFGKKGAGNVALLRELAEPMGIAVTALEPVTWKGETVSSSRIRRCLRRIPRSLSAYSVRTHRMPRTESFLQILDKVVFLLCPSAVLRGGGPEEYTGRWQITRIRSTYTTTARLSDCSVRGMKNVSMRFSAAITNRSAPMPRASCRRYAPRNSSRTP